MCLLLLPYANFVYLSVKISVKKCKLFDDQWEEFLHFRKSNWKQIPKWSMEDWEGFCYFLAKSNGMDFGERGFPPPQEGQGQRKPRDPYGMTKSQETLDCFVPRGWRKSRKETKIKKKVVKDLLMTILWMQNDCIRAWVNYMKKLKNTTEKNPVFFCEMLSFPYNPTKF